MPERSLAAAPTVALMIVLVLWIGFQIVEVGRWERAQHAQAELNGESIKAMRTQSLLLEDEARENRRLRGLLKSHGIPDHFESGTFEDPQPKD